ncbi:MAG: tripartite tricarboxylate transporter TctB family protein [Pseudothermotoga sp.]
MKDLIFSVVMLIFSVLLLIEASKLPEGIGALPGPGFFPTIIGIVILILSTILLTTVVYKMIKKMGVSKFQGDWVRTLLFMGILFGYAGFWGKGNFFINTAIMTFSLQIISGSKWFKALIGSLCLAGSIYLLFDKVFHVLLF